MVYFPAGTYLISSPISEYHVSVLRSTVLSMLSLRHIPCSLLWVSKQADTPYTSPLLLYISSW